MTATLLALLLACQDDSARAKQLLEDSAAALRKSKSIVIEIESKTLVGGEGGRVTTIRRKIALRLPDLVRHEYWQGESEYLWVQDGQHYWFLDRVKKEYAQYPHQKQPFHDVFPAELFLGESPGILLGSEIKVAKHKDGHAITWLEKRRGKPKKHWLWLSKDNLPLSYSEEGALGDGTAYDRDDEYTKIDLDPKLDEDTFKFVPPADATVKAPFKPEPQPADEVPKTAEAKAAIELLGKVAEALRAGPSLTYEADVTTTGPSERSWRMKAAAQRPNRFRVEHDFSLYVCDGTTCWYYDPQVKKHTQYQAAQMPFSAMERVIGLYLEANPDHVLRGAVELSVGKEPAADVISWVEGRDPSTRHQLKIDSKTRFPLEYSRVMTRDGDTWVFTNKYGAFEVAKEAPADTFKFSPPAGASEKTRADSEFEGALLAPGKEAPTLAGKDPSGKDISLADFKGKPVLLIFGGATLKELRRVQQIHNLFAKRGLAVVAVHREDGAKAIRDRFASEKFTFPALCPKEDFLNGPFGVRVSGTHYVIGADGKVAASMFLHESFGQSEETLRSALEKAVSGR